MSFTTKGNACLGISEIFFWRDDRKYLGYFNKLNVPPIFSLYIFTDLKSRQQLLFLSGGKGRLRITRRKRLGKMGSHPSKNAKIGKWDANCVQPGDYLKIGPLKNAWPWMYVTLLRVLDHCFHGRGLRTVLSVQAFHRNLWIIPLIFHSFLEPKRTNIPSNSPLAGRNL